MLKKHHQFVNSSGTYTKHEQEMAKLREHHERVMKDGALREATLVGAGVFVRTTDGKLAVAERYNKVIVSKRAA
ncbi:MAG: hypothetical protein ACJ8LG_19755 [Massilia sp.]